MEIFAEAVALKIFRSNLRPQAEIDRSNKNLFSRIISWQPHGLPALQTSWLWSWHADNDNTLRTYITTPEDRIL